MATIITVHGTFAHLGSSDAEAAGVSLPETERPWWQPESPLHNDIKQAFGGSASNVSYQPFVWSGNNSETERRIAARRLLEQLTELEKRGEDYCLVGHSHGGSVIANALMLSVGERQELNHLKRWITVGTPFVELRKERFLFLRLPLLLKALFVASLMLLFMLVFYLFAEAISGGEIFAKQNRAIAFGVATILTSLPFVLFYLVAKYLDHRELFFYRRRNIFKAQEAFADKWVSLTHEDDEAVNGLGSLQAANLNIFHRDFAVPALSLISVFLLPVIYIYLVTSPTQMVAIADFLKTQVYSIDRFENLEANYREDTKEIRQLRRQIRRTRKVMEDAGDDVVTRLNASSELKALRSRLSSARENLDTKYPEMMQIQRVSRFRKRFFEKDGKPCPNDQLCDGGRSLQLNSRLLLHLVTDEVSSWVVDDEVRRSAFGRIVRFAIPVLLVPIVFGVVAMAMVLVIQFLAGFISFVASRYLDDLTWREVKRSALGNDTETEVAVGAAASPSWINKARPFIPPEVGNAITDRSNLVTAQSLEKFRNAISELAFAEKSEDKSNVVFDYLTWRELVHTSYFEVPEFRRLLTVAIADAEGFQPGEGALDDPEAYAMRRWLHNPTGISPEDAERQV